MKIRERIRRIQLSLLPVYFAGTGLAILGWPYSY
jgi:hypothetical protein